MINIHATCIDLKGKGILLLGKSGSNKSGLALQMIELFQAKLVADDRTDLNVSVNKITASCPNTIKGKLEIRGIGIIDFPYVEQTVLRLAVELVERPEDIERLPVPAFYELENVKIPKIYLYSFDTAGCCKLKIACDELG